VDVWIGKEVNAMTEAQIVIGTADGPMPAFEAFPAGSARGGVLVIQEGFGVTSHIEGVTRRLAAAGWHAVAPAFYHRQRSPVLSYSDVDTAIATMGHLTVAGLAIDVTAGLDFLEEKGFGPARTGVIGFCMGGSISFYAATLRPVGAAVTFYGGGVAEGRFGLPPLIDLAPHLEAPWLGLFGDLDESIPPGEVEQLRQAVTNARVPTEVVRYPNADHGFNCDDRPAVFNVAAAGDAWERTLNWLRSHLRAGDQQEV
jgi:carboxymethylenebutenolidase